MAPIQHPTPSLLEDERIDRVNEQLRLIQKKAGLTYGTDAFLLSAFIRPNAKTKAIELGGGTGIISLLLAARKKVASVVSVEIQPAFADLIERNAALNGLESRVHPLCADLRDLRSADIGYEADLVFSNPPYMKCNAGKRNESDEKYIARHEVCGSIADFCFCGARLLRFGGKFACVWRPDRLTELLYALHATDLEPKRMTFVHADAATEPCMVLIEAIKGGAPSLQISAPLLLYSPKKDGEQTRELTPQAQDIYQNCDFSGFFSR